MIMRFGKKMVFELKRKKRIKRAKYLAVVKIKQTIKPFGVPPDLLRKLLSRLANHFKNNCI